jgi:hypothetical protein
MITDSPLFFLNCIGCHSDFELVCVPFPASSSNANRSFVSALWCCRFDLGSCCLFNIDRLISTPHFTQCVESDGSESSF